MTEVARTRTVHSSRDAVWALLADFPAISAWAPDVDHSRPLTTPATGRDATRRIQTGRVTLVERVVDWDPPHGMAYSIGGLPAIAGTVANEWRLAPAGDRTTTVTVLTRVDAGRRPRQQMVAALVARRLAAVSERMLAGLADHLDADARTGGIA